MAASCAPSTTSVLLNEGRLEASMAVISGRLDKRKKPPTARASTIRVPNRRRAIGMGTTAASDRALADWRSNVASQFLPLDVARDPPQHHPQIRMGPTR